MFVVVPFLRLVDFFLYGLQQVTVVVVVVVVVSSSSNGSLEVAIAAAAVFYDFGEGFCCCKVGCPSWGMVDCGERH